MTAENKGTGSCFFMSFAFPDFYSSVKLSSHLREEQQYSLHAWYGVCMQMNSNLVSAKPLKIGVIRSKCLVMLYTSLRMRQ